MVDIVKHFVQSRSLCSKQNYYAKDASLSITFYRVMLFIFNSLPQDKFVESSKPEAFASSELNMIQIRSRLRKG